MRYTAVDPATVTAVFDIGETDGSVASLSGRGVRSTMTRPTRAGSTVGDPVVFEFASGERRELTVEGICTEQDLAGRYVVSHALHESTGADQFDFSVYLQTSDGVKGQDARAAIATE